MKRRYSFLQKGDVFAALNRVRDALLAASDGNDVEQIMNGILTFDERIKVGRRIQIAESLLNGLSMNEIRSALNVGFSTIEHVANRLDKYEKCFSLIQNTSKRKEKEYQNKAYRIKSGSTKVFKIKEYAGLTRKDIKRNKNNK